MKKGQKIKRYPIGGEMLTVRQIARKPWCPTNEYTIYQRLARGMNIVEAITTGRYQTQKKWPYKGRMRSLNYLKNLPVCSVSEKTLSARLNLLGWPVELAVETPALPHSYGGSIEWRKARKWATPVDMILKDLEEKDEAD